MKQIQTVACILYVRIIRVCHVFKRALINPYHNSLESQGLISNDQNAREEWIFFLFTFNFCNWTSTQEFKVRSGSVLECLTRDRRAAGSSLTGVTALCP